MQCTCAVSRVLQGVVFTPFVGRVVNSKVLTRNSGIPSNIAFRPTQCHLITFISEQTATVPYNTRTLTNKNSLWSFLEAFY